MEQFLCHVFKNIEFEPKNSIFIGKIGFFDGFFEVFMMAKIFSFENISSHLKIFHREI
jgi:hypothetical protein